MNRQSNRKGLIVAMGILLIANIILLAFFLYNGPDGKKGDRKSPMTVYLQSEIGFTDEQMAEFETIKSDHRSQAKDLFDKMRSNKEAAFKELAAKGFSDSAIAQAAAYSAQQQKELEINMLQHIRNIRNICTPQQRQRFDTGYYKVMNRGRDPKSPNGK